MNKTTAQIKDERLTIMAPNARTASVMSLELSKVQEGEFTLNETKDGGTALEFKPAGRKTSDVIAVYNKSSDASKALKAVFEAIGGSKKRNVIGFMLYILKILALTIFVIIIIATLLFFALGQTVKDVATEGAMVSGNNTQDIIDTAPLPVGEPFLVDEYVKTLEE